MPFQPLSADIVSALKDVEVYLWRLNETVEELKDLLYDPSLLQMPPYAHFKSEKRRAEWLAVRVLLSKVCPLRVHIAYEESGRPFLSPSIAELSISHTRGVVALALSSQKVGIDVEQFGDRSFHLKDYFLQKDELDFETVDDPELLALYMWSAKESVYKLVDLPGTELKSDIRLTLIAQTEEEVEFAADVNRNPKPIRIRGFKMDGYVLTVASFV